MCYNETNFAKAIARKIDKFYKTLTKYKQIVNDKTVYYG